MLCFNGKTKYSGILYILPDHLNKLGKEKFYVANKLSNICWVIEKAREFQKNIYFYFIDYAKAVDCVDHNKLWKILKEMGILHYIKCEFCFFC